MGDAPDVPERIDPASIPTFTGNTEQLQTDCTNLASDARAIRRIGRSVHNRFQGLSGYYQTPEAEDLFATTTPVRDDSDTFASDLNSVQSALRLHRAAIAPLVSQLDRVRGEAWDFYNDVIQKDKHWQSDQDHVDRNNELVSEVSRIVGEFWEAERNCANKITELVNGTQWVEDDGSGGDDMYGVNPDDMAEAQETPWGSQVERNPRGWEIHHHVKSFVWDGVVVDGIWGTLKGLGALVGFQGAEAAGEAWKGLGQLATGLALLTSPVGMLSYQAMSSMDPDNPVSQWMDDSLDTTKEAGKAFVAWDTWGDDPARAAGATTFNVVTTVVTGGVGAGVKFGGTAGAILNTTARVGNFIDPTTHVINAGIHAGRTVAKLPQLGDMIASAARLTDEMPNANMPDISPTPVRDLPDGTQQLPDGTPVPESGSLPELPGNSEAVSLPGGGVRNDHGTVLDAGDGTLRATDGSTLDLTDGSVRVGGDVVPPRADVVGGDGLPTARPGEQITPQLPNEMLPVGAQAIPGGQAAGNVAELGGDAARFGNEIAPGSQLGDVPPGRVGDTPGGTAPHGPSGSYTGGGGPGPGTGGSGGSGAGTPGGGGAVTPSEGGSAAPPGSGGGGGGIPPQGPGGGPGAPGGGGTGGSGGTGGGGPHDHLPWHERPAPTNQVEADSYFVDRANRDPGWFKENYKINGHRISQHTTHFGYHLPQLVEVPPGSRHWVGKETLPPPIEEKYLRWSASADRSGAQPEVVRELDDAARVRSEAIAADKQPHKALDAARKAYEANPTPENLRVYERVSEVHSPLHRDMTKSIEDMGEFAASHHAIPDHYPNAVRLDDGKPGNNRFDQVYRDPDTGRMVVVEAKGSPTATLGDRMGLEGLRVKQGTREYFETIIEEMKNRARRERNPAEAELAKDLQKALKANEVDYVLVKAKEGGTQYGGYDMSQFDISQSGPSTGPTTTGGGGGTSGGPDLPGGGTSGGPDLPGGGTSGSPDVPGGGGAVGSGGGPDVPGGGGGGAAGADGASPLGSSADTPSAPGGGGAVDGPGGGTADAGNAPEASGASAGDAGQVPGGTDGSFGTQADGSWTGEGGARLDPEANAAATEFLETAARAEPRITSTMEELVGRTDGGHLTGLDYRLKGEDSLKRKVASSVMRNADRTVEQALGTMKDSVRYTVEMPSGNYTSGVQSVVDELHRRGFENITFKDSWNSSGYKGINSTWRDGATGHAFEVQFHTPESFAAKMDTHGLYEQQRLPDTSPERRVDLQRQQDEIFDAVPVPRDVGNIEPGRVASETSAGAATPGGGAIPEQPTGGTGNTDPPDGPPAGQPADSPPPGNRSVEPEGAYLQGEHGGWSGAGWIRHDTFTELEVRQAAEVYEQVRGTDNAVDLPDISRNTGVPESVLSEFKAHFFQTQHTVPVAPGQVETGWFTPRKDLAELWTGAREGTLTDREVIRFRRWAAHEYVEGQLMQSGIPYLRDQPDLWNWDATNGYGNNMPEHWSDAGAHILAPNENLGGFRHYERRLDLEQPTQIAEDFSNIGTVVREIKDMLRARGVDL